MEFGQKTIRRDSIQTAAICDKNIYELLKAAETEMGENRDDQQLLSTPSDSLGATLAWLH